MSMMKAEKKQGSLARDFGKMLIGLLLLQSLFTVTVATFWIRKSSHELDQAVFEEQGRFLLPSLQDSLSYWEGVGPRNSWPSQLRHRMQQSLGDLENLGLAWVDKNGNRAVVGLLHEDPRHTAMLDALVAGDLKALNRLTRRAHYPWLSSSQENGHLLVVRRSHPSAISHERTYLLIIMLTIPSIVAAFAGWILSRPLILRFELFQTAFRALGHGEEGHDLKDEHRDELASLATEFNQMRQRMNSLTAQVAASDKRRRTLITEVSHELGAPLTTVQGHLEIALNTSLDEDLRSHLKIARQQARRMDELVSDLLLLAKLEDTCIKLRRDSFDIVALAKDEIAAIELACLQWDIELELHFPASEMLVVADSRRCAQILRNLLRNATQQLADSPPESPCLHFSLRREEEMILVEVSDNGPGISPQILDHIFDRYFRPSASQIQGSGLGLTISKQLAELQGGYLVASSPGAGKGATFLLGLPSKEISS